MTVEAIRYRYYDIANALGASKSLIHFATTPQHDGSPHIEHHGINYYYIVTERGTEFERRQTENPDDILYWLVADLTFDIACKYELNHRVIGMDSRRVLFQKNIELLESIDHNWSERKRVEYEAVLAKHPYSDANTSD